MRKPLIAGIYKIKSKIKPECEYYGSSTDMSERWHEHRRLLRNQLHHNIILQHHVNKYGHIHLRISTF